MQKLYFYVADHGQLRTFCSEQEALHYIGRRLNQEGRNADLGAFRFFAGTERTLALKANVFVAEEPNTDTP